MNIRGYLDTLNGKPPAVLGLGKSGLSVVAAAVQSGVVPIVWDDRPAAQELAMRDGAEIVNLPALDDGSFGNYGALILSPGIPLYHPAPHPVVSKANAAGLEVIGDLEVFYRSYPSLQTIGITGTNGKSSTTALINHIFQTLKKPSLLGGNIGTPVLSLPVSHDAFYVLEISSYQMDLCPRFRPSISVLLNITPDHLDRHGTMARYAQAKAAIMDGAGFGICGVDDDWCQDIYDRISHLGVRRMTPISTERPLINGVYVQNGHLVDSMDQEEGVEIANLDDFQTLKGGHNHQNICAAYAVCRRAALPAQEIVGAIKSYPGLAHRQFLVRGINGIAYINDSKATNAQATAKALASYQNIYLIAGGRPKEGGLNGIEPWLSRLRHVFLIGEAAGAFQEWLNAHGVDTTICLTLERAVKDAHTAAQAARGKPWQGGVVLLSPACASWDQFDSFEHRGDVFVSLVKALNGEG